MVEKLGGRGDEDGVDGGLELVEVLMVQGEEVILGDGGRIE